MKYLMSVVLILTLPLAVWGQTCNDKMPRSAPSSRYLLRDNGQSVLDVRTNLIWLRCPFGSVWNGAGCHRNKAFFYTSYWSDALQAAQAVKAAGHDDWRLPNIKELMSLLEYACSAPMLNTYAFPDDNGYFTWSSTPVGDSNIGYSEAFWVLDFSGLSEYGGNLGYSSQGDFAVRLVRNAP